MPVLETRYEHEAELAEALANVGGEFRARLLEAAGDPPDARNVPQSLWDEYRTRTEEELRAVAIIVFLLAWEGMDLGFLYPPQESTARLWAYGRAGESTASIVATTRQRFAQAAAVSATRAALAAEMGEVFSLSRTAAAAVTEVTAAASAGEIAAGDYVRTSAGIELIPFWQTELDERVCKICRPLDNMPRERWEMAYPDGPPAHVNCRCSLDWRPKVA